MKHYVIKFTPDRGKPFLFKRGEHVFTTYFKRVAKSVQSQIRGGDPRLVVITFDQAVKEGLTSYNTPVWKGRIILKSGVGSIKQ